MRSSGIVKKKRSKGSKASARLTQARSAACLLKPAGRQQQQRPEWECSQQQYNPLTEEEVQRRKQAMSAVDNNLQGQAHMHNLFDSREARLTRKHNELKEWENKLRLVQIDVDSRNDDLANKLAEFSKSEKRLVAERDELIVERQKLFAMRAQLTKHQKEVSAKITKLAQETKVRAEAVLENNLKVEKMEVVVKRMTEERDAAVYECKEALEKATKAAKSEEKMKEKVAEMEGKCSAADERVFGINKELEGLSMREQQLKQKQQEHEVLLQAYLERKQEQEADKKKLTAREKAIGAREKTMEEAQKKMQSAESNVAQREAELGKSKQNFSELQDLYNSERTLFNTRKEAFDRQFEKFEIMQKGLDVRTTEVEDKEKILKKVKADLEKETGELDQSKEEWDAKLVDLIARERKCADIEVSQQKKQMDMMKMKAGILKERQRLKDLDRNLQQFGEDCETQREINEKESERLLKIKNEML